MKQFVLIGLLLAGASWSANAAQCVVGTFSAYEALGATGCEIGGVNFSYFDLLVTTVVNANNIGAGQIIVTPLDGLNGPQLNFSANWGASGLAASYLATLSFRATTTGGSIYLSSSNLTTDVSRTGLAGIASVAEVNCLGGLLNPGGTLCLGGGITATGTAIASLLNTNVAASIGPFNNHVTMVDVVKVISLTGAIGSSASINNITESFGTSVPEPSSMLLISGAMLVLGGLRRWKKRD